MRVSKDKNDSAYDARERKVFLNDKEISGEWISADEFRRVIIMADGRTMFGNVHVERLPELKIEIDIDHIINEPVISETNKSFPDGKIFVESVKEQAKDNNPYMDYTLGNRLKSKDRK